MADSEEHKSVARLLLSSASQDLAACAVLANAAGIGDAVVGFHAQLDELNPYSVEARYGTIWPEGLDRARSLAAAAQVVTWAETQVGQAPSPM